MRLISILLPLCIAFVFVPFTQEYYDLPKWIVLMLISFCVFMAWGVKVGKTKKIVITLSPIILSLVALAVVSLASLIIASTNKGEALTAPIGFATFLALILLFSYLGQFVTQKDKVVIQLSYIFTGFLLSIIAIGQFLGIGKILFPTQYYLADPLWTPIGSPFALVSFLLLIIPMTIQQIVVSMRTKYIKSIWFTFAALLILLAITVTVYELYPKLPETFLPLSSGWNIFVSIFSSVKSALFGVGIENFLAAFTKGKSLATNMTPLWDDRFTASSSYLLHLATTMGIFGALASLLYMYSSILAALRSPLVRISSLTCLLVIIIFAITPPSTSVFILMTFLIFTYETHHTITIPLPGRIPFIQWAIPIMVSVISIGGLYLVARVYRGELLFYQSIKAINASDGTKAYGYQIDAILQNPFVTRYHMAYSQTNLALANSIASQTSSAAATLSLTDKETVSRLMQQAIREAKTATNLNPDNVLTWENLGQIYESMVGLADGADNWATAAYLKAAELDPTNPILRIKLATLYLRQNDTDRAAYELESAIKLKPDLASAYYNLAYVYRLRKDYIKEIEALNQTLSLVKVGSNDYNKVTQELSEAKRKLEFEDGP